MIDSVATTIAKDTAKVIAQDTVEHARDVVQEGLVELQDRLKGASLVTRRRRHRRRVTTRTLVVVFLAGGIIAAIVVWRRRMAPDDVAPDPFGAAVEEERAAGLLQGATP